MRLPLLMSAGVLLVALLPCPPCRALLMRGPAPGARQAPQLPQPRDFFQPPLQPLRPLRFLQPLKPLQPLQPLRPLEPLESLQPLKPLQPLEPLQPQAEPALLRTGEEDFLRQGDLNKSPAVALWLASSPLSRRSDSRLSPNEVAANFFRALRQLRSLPPRRLDSPADPAAHGAESALGGRQEAPERERRLDAPLLSLDLTFHLLRETLAMAKAEKLAEQARINRKLMDMAGK